MPADKNDDSKPASFKVSDRRIFSESGEPKPPSPSSADPSAASASAPAQATSPAPQPQPPSPSPSPSPPASASGSPASAEGRGGRPTADATDLPTIDFHTFILSLGSSALLHLGELDQPDGAEARPDLRMAKHTIDIISMLEAKTKGNLSPPEERLMESLLYDLRLRYVERSKTPASGG